MRESRPVRGEGSGPRDPFRRAQRQRAERRSRISHREPCRMRERESGFVGVGVGAGTGVGAGSIRIEPDNLEARAVAMQPQYADVAQSQ
ncbi:hypothetical protein [Burkholderia pseudomallei]|uniref:hypothetical protein n=1 Tax=Burkholderia pseudomallei TaxID=28450 RepID=UPI001F460EB8|nr:hypothetical protein [Burkholderia pseudomallei]